MEKIFKGIFSTTNTATHKIIYVMGIKIKIKKTYECLHKEELTKSFNLLQDKLSKKIFNERVKYLNTNNEKYKIPQSKYEEYCHPEVHVEKNDIVIDAGISEWIDPTVDFAKTVGARGLVLGFEPEPECFKSSTEQIQKLGISNIKIYPYGLWDKQDILRISQSGRSSSLVWQPEDCSQIDCQLVALDEFAKENDIKKVDFIKMDIEGAEEEALIGCTELIKANKPKLSICVYHKPEHLYKLILWINSLNLGYKFWLGHHRENVWSTVLYAKVL